MGNLGVADTARILDICRETGVTTLDTADVCSFGGAEEILGEALVALRVIAERLEHREAPAEFLNVTFQSAAYDASESTARQLTLHG